MQQLVSSQTLTSTTAACRVYFTTSYTTLAQRPQANREQARCCDSPVFEEQSSDVLERPLHSGHRRQQSTTTISQPASTDCTALSANYTLRSSGFLCGGYDALELTIPTEFRGLSVTFGDFQRNA